MRFQPDSVWLALMRYFDMVAPDANIYVEIPAPDIRFAAIVLLAAAVLLSWKRLPPGRKPVFALLAMIVAATAVWLATTGNGRYFMAVLVCAGPVAIALICMLPVTRTFQAALAALLIAGQAFVLWQQPPWDTWTVKHWSDSPYFQVELGPQEKKAGPTTYASLSLLTYSLVAPQFPEGTRWINLFAGSATPRDAQWTRDFLRQAAAAGPVRIIAPSVPAGSGPDGLPTPEMVGALQKLIAPRDLRIDGACRYLPSGGLEAMAETERRAPRPGEIRPGFWTCPVAYVPDARHDRTPEPPPEVLAGFRKAGEVCARFFPAGEAHPVRLNDGWVVNYGSQTRFYVLDNKDVWYHFWRALNPVRVGSLPDFLAGRSPLDCGAIRNDGAWRTGAP